MNNKNFTEEMGLIRTPQFPGQQLGKMSIEQVRDVIKRQKRLKGYSWSVPTGASQFNIELSGTARVLVGIALLPNYNNSNTFDNVTQIEFQVNNEIIIAQLNPNFLANFLNNQEYYYIPRPLSGQDEMTIKFINTGASTEDVNAVFYYL